MHEKCIVFKLDKPIALGSGLKITNLIFWEKKNSSRYHAELVHSQVGNLISMMKLNRFYLSIMNEMSGLETIEEMLGVISERASQLSKRSLKVQANNSKLKLLKASFRHCKKWHNEE
jgi:hypothetical protein